MPLICPKYGQDMPKICQKMTKICPRYAQNMARIWPRYAKDMTKTCPREVHRLTCLWKWASGLGTLTRYNHYQIFAKYKKNTIITD